MLLKSFNFKINIKVTELSLKKSRENDNYLDLYLKSDVEL